MRTVAEILRRLSQKEEADASVRDMAAMLVYCLREIDETIDESVRAWEKRDYWIKVEEFRQRWRWAGQMADELLAMVVNDEWDSLPAMMMKLLPHFADIKVIKLTRKESLWEGAYDRLLREHSS